MTVNNRGVTLIELLIVVGIASILAGMAAYTLRLTNGDPLSVQKATLLEALIDARNAANLRSDCVRVRIEGNVYRSEIFAPDISRRCNGPFTAAPLRTIDEIDFGAEGMTISPFSTGSTELVFNSRGGLVVDQMVTFDMTDPQGKKAGFRIYPAIGQVRAR